MGVSSVTIVTKGRQIRKSTLAKVVGGDAPYLSLDSFLTLDQARHDPASPLGTGEPVIIDEVQRAPDLLLAIKQR